MMKLFAVSARYKDEGVWVISWYQLAGTSAEEKIFLLPVLCIYQIQSAQFTFNMQFFLLLLTVNYYAMVVSFF